MQNSYFSLDWNTLHKTRRLYFDIFPVVITGSVVNSVPLAWIISNKHNRSKKNPLTTITSLFFDKNEMNVPKTLVLKNGQLEFGIKK